jgi:uncharacterized membrane protein
MEWVILVVYIVGLVIAYMISILVTGKKPSEWTANYSNDFVFHIICVIWPASLPIVIVCLLGLGFILTMDKFYDFVKGGSNAIR